MQKNNRPVYRQSVGAFLSGTRSAVKFPQNSQRPNLYGRFRMVRQIQQQTVTEGVPRGAREWNEHGFREARLEKRLEFLQVLAGERGDIVKGGPETQRPRQF